MAVIITGDATRLTLQQTPQHPHVAQPVDLPHRANQRTGAARTEHRRKQAAAFGGDILTRHRIGRAAAHRARVMAQPPPVVRDDLDDRLRGFGFRQRLAADDLDALSQP